MKQLITLIALILAFVSVDHIWAQEEDQVVTAEVVDDGSGISVDLSLSSKEVSDDESINKLTSVIRKVAGDEVADEVVVEVSGLSDAEKAELAEAIREGIHIDSDEIPGWVGPIAILSIILFFSVPLLILIAVFWYGYRKRRQKMDLIQVYLDAGKDVPPQVLSTFDQSGGSFRSGLILAGAGVGIVAAFNAAGDASTGALGLIPLFVGIAKLVYWFFEERQRDPLS